MRKRSCGERQWVICTGQRALMIAGVVLVAAGLIVLLLCIPAWAWAALLGVALAIAGLVLICVGRRCRNAGADGVREGAEAPARGCAVSGEETAEIFISD